LKAKQQRQSPATGIAALERLEATTPWKRAAIVAAVLIAAVCVLFPDVIFWNRVFFVPDTQAPLSFTAVGEAALKSGTYPLWNPYLFCGMPSFASLAFTPYVYPPSFITYFLQHILHFPEMTWLLFHYVLAGIGVYLLARSLGARSSVSLLAGITFMAMPNYVAMGAYGHGSQACAIAYMPYALLFSWNIMKGYRRPSMAALLAITLGFQMLRGHLQIAFYTYLIIGLLVLFESVRLLRSRDPRGAAIGIGAVVSAVVAAVGIAGVLVFPVHQYAALSIRGGGGGGGGLDYGYATNWSLHPKEMLTFVFPWAFGFGKSTYWGTLNFTDYPNYLGLVTVVCCVLALALARSAATWLLVVVALFATTLSFGKFLPVLYGPMFKFFPYFNKFRVPVMALIMQQLALAALLGIGLEAYLRRSTAGTLPSWLGSRRWRWVIVGLGILFVLVLVGSGGVRESIVRNPAVRAKVQGGWLDVAASAYAADLVATILIALVACFVLFLAASRRLLAGTIVLLLGVLALIDLSVVDRKILRPEREWSGAQPIIERTSARDEFLKPDELIRFFQADSTYFRIFPAPAAQLGSWSYSVPPFNENRFMVFGIFSIGGYHAAKLRNYQNVMEEMFASFNRGTIPVGILDMLNTKYVLSLFPLFKEGTGWPIVWNRQNVYVYRNPTALPRVFLVDRFTVMSQSDALVHLTSSDFDPSREVILNEQPSPPPDSVGGSTARVVDYGLNAITVRARLERPCILVMSEIAYPGWKASVDGQATAVLAADYCLRAIPLSAGDHEIRMHFSSPVLRASLVVSLVSFALALAVPVGQGIAARRRR
jgi:hypothetical protein